jgi:hypothetical protein
MNHIPLTKNKLPDRRFRINKTLQVKERMFWQDKGWMVMAIILGLLAGATLTSTLWREANKPLKTPIVEPMVFEVGKVEAVEPKEDCESKVGYIRCASRNAGLSDKDGSMLIRIARAESYCEIRPYEVNYLYKTNPRKYSAVGSFMITQTTWDGNKCTGDRFNHEDSTDCAIKIYKKRGTQPWNESRHLKSGNGWGDEKQCYKAFK